MSTATEHGRGKHDDADTDPSRYVSLTPGELIWDDVYTIAPLVLVGTIEADGSPDIAPKHQVMPIGHGTLFTFACSPAHATYRNALANSSFTVGFPTPEMVLQTSLAAGPRDSNGDKPTLDLLSLSPARVVDGVLVEGCRVHLECTLERVVDDLDDRALVIGRVVVAHVSERARISTHENHAELVDRAPLLAYLHPGRVASVRASKEFPFHRGFHR